MFIWSTKSFSQEEEGSTRQSHSFLLSETLVLRAMPEWPFAFWSHIFLLLDCPMNVLAWTQRLAKHLDIRPFAFCHYEKLLSTATHCVSRIFLSSDNRSNLFQSFPVSIVFEISFMSDVSLGVLSGVSRARKKKYFGAIAVVLWVFHNSVNLVLKIRYRRALNQPIGFFSTLFCKDLLFFLLSTSSTLPLDLK